MKRLALATLALLSTTSLLAQMALPSSGATAFKDTSAFRPPAGATIAIIEFEDMECPLCAQTSPIVFHAMAKYGIPRVHHDFIIPSHIWSRTAAIDARYLEDNVSPKMAEAFRRDIFASQSRIASRDDLFHFASSWFQAHGQAMPFILDGNGRCAKEVQDDCLLAIRSGVAHTPTLIVATQSRWIEVTDPQQLDRAIEVARATLKESSAPHGTKPKRS